jgi:hypothetical protein
VVLLRQDPRYGQGSEDPSSKSFPSSVLLALHPLRTDGVSRNTLYHPSLFYPCPLHLVTAAFEPNSLLEVSSDGSCSYANKKLTRLLKFGGSGGYSGAFSRQILLIHVGICISFEKCYFYTGYCLKYYTFHKVQ